MKPGYKITTYGLDNKNANQIEVLNYKGLNEVAHFCFNSFFIIHRDKNTVGFWKVKK
jgi:hypothetical protein